MFERLKKLPVRKLIISFVFLSLVFSIIYITMRLILAPARPVTEEYIKIKSDYVLMLLQCSVGVFALFLPSILNRRWQIIFPSGMTFLFVIFLYCAIYLGEVRSFYYLIPHWDTMLHTFSGAMLGALGFSVVSLLNDSTRTKIHLSPLFLSMFAFCFAVTLGVLWEVYEFAADYVLGTNMQKFASSDGVVLIGRAAVLDTMKDLIVDILGAFVMTFIGYISIAKNPEWLQLFSIRIKHYMKSKTLRKTSSDDKVAK